MGKFHWAKLWQFLGLQKLFHEFFAKIRNKCPGIVFQKYYCENPCESESENPYNADTVKI